MDTMIFYAGGAIMKIKPAEFHQLSADTRYTKKSSPSKLRYAEMNKYNDREFEFLLFRLKEAGKMGRRFSYRDYEQYKKFIPQDSYAQSIRRLAKVLGV